MKIIDFEMIKNLNLSTDEYMEWTKQVFLDKKNCQLPPKISMKKEGHIFINVMPSIIDSLNVAGVKIVSRYPERKPALDSQIILYDSNTGQNLALLDGNIITAYRTAAVAVLAIETLAIEDYKNVAIIGLGNIAYAFMNIFSKRIKDKINLKVYKYKDQAERFLERFQHCKNINFNIVDNYEDLIKNSDIIVSCVTSTDINFGKDEWFKDGCLVVPIHTLGFQNCDLFFDKFIVDDIGHVQGFKYFDKFKEVHELSEVLTNKDLGRKDNKEKIMAYNIGNSIFDIYFAKKIYDMCKNEKTKEIDLKAPQEKEWV